MAVQLKALGYWRTAGQTQLPDPRELIDSAWDASEREIVSEYLEEGQVARKFMGISRCLICDAVVGSHDSTDGEFMWPSGLAHYVMVHAVRIPAVFISHIMHRRDLIDSVDVDHSWWHEHARDV